MPLYEYWCSNCQARIEKLQKISQEPLKICPECNQESLQKLISKVGFRLKGGGWYETDFKTNPKKQNLVATKDEAVVSGEHHNSKTTESTSSKETTNKHGDTATQGSATKQETASGA